jgi:hypothetical protein
VPKGEALVLIRTTEGNLVFEHKGRVLGAVHDRWVADNLVLAYFAKDPISPPVSLRSLGGADFLAQAERCGGLREVSQEVDDVFGKGGAEEHHSSKVIKSHHITACRGIRRITTVSETLSSQRATHTLCRLETWLVMCICCTRKETRPRPGGWIVLLCEVSTACRSVTCV